MDELGPLSIVLIVIAIPGSVAIPLFLVSYFRRRRSL